MSCTSYCVLLEGFGVRKRVVASERDGEKYSEREKKREMAKKSKERDKHTSTNRVQLYLRREEPADLGADVPDCPSFEA